VKEDAESLMVTVIVVLAPTARLPETAERVTQLWLAAADHFKV
jgi:hypothetical protein